MCDRLLCHQNFGSYGTFNRDFLKNSKAGCLIEPVHLIEWWEYWNLEKFRKYFFLPGGRCGPGCTPGLNNEPNIFEIGLYGLYAFWALA